MFAIKEMMAKETDLKGLRSLIPKLVDLFKTQYRKIKKREIALEKLVVAQTLSRDLQDFKAGSPASTAAFQLQKEGKLIRAGQTVEYIRVKGKPNSLSWHLVRDERAIDLDTQWYCDQLLRAADEILSPFGVPKDTLEDWLNDRGVYWLPEDFVHQQEFLPKPYALFPVNDLYSIS
jgi:DNA polymerase elongation subunit (family B)